VATIVAQLRRYNGTRSTDTQSGPAGVRGRDPRAAEHDADADGRDTAKAGAETEEAYRCQKAWLIIPLFLGLHAPAKHGRASNP
jgi:hypothetical protein